MNEFDIEKPFLKQPTAGGKFFRAINFPFSTAAELAREAGARISTRFTENDRKRWANITARRPGLGAITENYPDLLTQQIKIYLGYSGRPDIIWDDKTTKEYKAMKEKIVAGNSPLTYIIFKKYFGTKDEKARNLIRLFTENPGLVEDVDELCNIEAIRRKYKEIIKTHPNFQTIQGIEALSKSAAYYLAENLVTDTRRLRVVPRREYARIRESRIDQAITALSYFLEADIEIDRKLVVASLNDWLKELGLETSVFDTSSPVIQKERIYWQRGAPKYKGESEIAQRYYKMFREPEQALAAMELVAKRTGEIAKDRSISSTDLPVLKAVSSIAGMVATEMTEILFTEQRFPKEAYLSSLSEPLKNIGISLQEVKIVNKV